MPRRQTRQDEQKLHAKLVHRLYEGGFAAGRQGTSDESEKVLLPGSTFLLMWELVSFAMLMYTAIAVPFQLAFSSGSGRWDVDQPTTYIETVVDLFFIADIFRNFRTAYYDGGDLVTSPRQIALHYVGFWFWIDLVASFPLDWFMGAIADEGEGGDGGSETQLLLLLRLSKLWKLLRLLRLWRVGLRSKVDHADSSGLGELVLSVTASTTFWFACNLSILFLAIHVNGCLQVFFAKVMSEGDDSDTDADTETDADAGAGADSAALASTWVTRAGLANASTLSLYTASLVHALLQMLLVDAGLVPPRRVEENLLYLASLLVGAFLFMHMLASLTSRFNTALSGSHGAYQCKLENLEKWMAYNQFDAHLRQRLRVFFELKHPGGCLFDDDAILGDLSRPLREEASLHKTRELIAKLHIPVDTEQGYELASRLAMALQRRVFLNGDVLIKQGSNLGSLTNPGMFFLTSGEVEIHIRDKDTGKRKKIDYKGDQVVGEMSLLSRKPATADVEAATFCDSFLLRKDDYDPLVDTFPLLEQWIKQVAQVRGFDDYTEALKKFDDLSPPETITFVKKEHLLSCERLMHADRACTSFNVLEDFWAEGRSIDDLLPSDAFVKVPWEQLDSQTFGVLTYTWQLMQWRDILLKLQGTEMELFWIDIFCIDQRLESEEKMRTIKQTLKIYAHAKEHHVLGLRTLRRGWCLCELSARRGAWDEEGHKSEIHSDFEDEETREEEERAIKQFTAENGVPTFSRCEFTKATDRPVVKRLVLEQWGSEHKFNDFLFHLVRQVAPRVRPSSASVRESFRESEHVFKHHDWGDKRKQGTQKLRRFRGRHSASVSPARRATMKGIASSFPDIKKGAIVQHEERGRGRVLDIENDHKSDREVVVIEFERKQKDKQVHSYGAHSLVKFTVIDSQGTTAAAAMSDGEDAGASSSEAGGQHAGAGSGRGRGWRHRFK